MEKSCVCEWCTRVDASAVKAGCQPHGFVLVPYIPPVITYYNARYDDGGPPADAQ